MLIYFFWVKCQANKNKQTRKKKKKKKKKKKTTFRKVLKGE